MHATSAPEDVHALDVEGLLHPSVAFVSCRDDDGALLGVGALKRHDGGLAELKSMHVAAAARGRGAGRALLQHLVDLARSQGARRVSLETGTQPAFDPAHRLYRAAGFVPCPPFADYRPSPASAFLTLRLDGTAD